VSRTPKNASSALWANAVPCTFFYQVPKWDHVVPFYPKVHAICFHADGQIRIFLLLFSFLICFLFSLVSVDNKPTSTPISRSPPLPNAASVYIKREPLDQHKTLLHGFLSQHHPSLLQYTTSSTGKIMDSLFIYLFIPFISYNSMYINTRNHKQRSKLLPEAISTIQPYSLSTYSYLLSANTRTR
jgi:hypothetical protein